MFRCVLVLMVAQLPVCGWAADMMAVSMTAQQHPSIRPEVESPGAAAVLFLQASASISAECPMIPILAVYSFSDTSDAGGDARSPIGKVCTTCQLWTTLAAELSGRLEHAPFVSIAPPICRTAKFTGAAVASVLKPSIP